MISILDTVRPAIEQLDRVRSGRCRRSTSARARKPAAGAHPSILKPVPEPVASPREALPSEAPRPRRSVYRRFTLLIAVAIVAVVILMTFGPTIRSLLTG